MEGEGIAWTRVHEVLLLHGYHRRTLPAQSCV